MEKAELDSLELDLERSSQLLRTPSADGLEEEEQETAVEAAADTAQPALDMETSGQLLRADPGSEGLEEEAAKDRAEAEMIAAAWEAAQARRDGDADSAGTATE